MSAIIGLDGWLTIDDVYDGYDNWCGVDIDLWTDGPHLGNSHDLTHLLAKYDGQHIRITISPAEPPTSDPPATLTNRKQGSPPHH